MMGASSNELRPADRPNCGSFYLDKNGDGHWAYEDIGAGFTVAGAWASLRKCWRGYRIASGNNDDDGKITYAGRIVFLCYLLKKVPPRFQELELEKTVRNDDDNYACSAEEYSEEPDGSSHYSGGSVDPNCYD